MGHAEIIPLDDVRANQHRRQLRQRLHDCFDLWLDTLESALDTTAMTLPDCNFPRYLGSWPLLVKRVQPNPQPCCRRDDTRSTHPPPQFHSAP